MSDHPTPLGGTCSARFEPLRELFAAKLESGEDLGASLAVNIDGEMVVDLWGGWADEARTVPWTKNTIANVTLGHGPGIFPGVGSPRSCWSTAASLTSTQPSPSTGPSLRSTASR